MRATQYISKSESRKKLTAAYRAIYGVGALSLLLGILANNVKTKTPDTEVLVILFLSLGVLYLFLGFLVQRKSIVALSIAVAGMVLNALAGIYNLLQTGAPTGLIVPAIFFSQTWQGFKAIQALKRGA